MPCLPLTSASYTRKILPTTTTSSIQTTLSSFDMGGLPLPAIPAHLYEGSIERIEGSNKQQARKSKRSLMKKKTFVCVGLGLVGGKRTYVPSKLSECETADFNSEPAIDSVDLNLNENERDVFIEDVTGVVALEEEYRSWCVDTQARDRERTAARYGVARVCSVVAPCSA